jgi:endoglucanase
MDKSNLRAVLLVICTAIFACGKLFSQDASYIRINQLGYLPNAVKVAVFATKGREVPGEFSLINAYSEKVVYKAQAAPAGAYGPFAQTARLDFSSIRLPAKYYLQCGSARSPVFAISDTVYRGSADFVLRYMRQQRSGYNPFLKDSCHTLDGYTVYGPMPDNTFVDVSGGWHDASDYLQYVTTSANATYHLLAAYRDFPNVFSDKHLSNGLEGANKRADVLDEAKWGLDWLLKMHPRQDWMFNQLADDRDHIAMRLPTRDSVDYGMGKGLGRTLYFATGKPQGLGKYKNKSTGLASTAGKFAYSFALGSGLFEKTDPSFAKKIGERSLSAYNLGKRSPGVCQTAPNRAPYYYEEMNWTDDMELAAAALYQSTADKKYYREAIAYAEKEKITPWLGADTMRHYQWYPFHNFGHYELAASAAGDERKKLIAWYREGIERVWQKAASNAFYRGIPFTWCSNNLTTSFAIQCALYRKLSGDKKYEMLEQACIDWLFGCNPWGTSMVYGLPESGDYPAHPHSSLAETFHYRLDGGLVDGPVYSSIFNQLRGLTLYTADTYKDFQSDLAVYHDDAGDYSSNEPTMDGTASLVYLMASLEEKAGKEFRKDHGAITRGNESRKEIAIVFTGDEFADGGDMIASALSKEKVQASFFLTGNFYRNFPTLIKKLNANGHYLGSHSDRHLLYADWKNRDSLLVSKEQFTGDMRKSFAAMRKYGISPPKYFLPPYEWYNDSIAYWTTQLAGMQLINYSPGTRSNADYTWPEMGKQYLSSDSIYNSITGYEANNSSGLNGFILLLHIGTDPRRKDKFYNRLPDLIRHLRQRGYVFKKIDELLN